ncbi:PilZ domain-containing protein [Thermosulfurimonas marina]|uniref:PilZ domain-containing protein n=1 Tax=Thermosulfurimonas marina TaxID=2047767 RepID=A0A6H1WSU2_9BACT|nr:PilZ domain-containing protein [Thermosulfurimonas marina]QJA06196.1 PilZ domain-containing protein [Thermosulfurimonas marina]
MWQPWEGGYEVNRDPAHIQILLREIQEAGYWVVFVSGGFRSGPTLLLHMDEERLVFDYPRPWVSGLATARVIYRDASNIEYFFRVRILGEDRNEKYIFTTRPTEIFRLERRMYYRVPTPPGSRAVFKWKEKEISGDIVNISAGGLALIRPSLKVPEREILTEGRLELMLSATRPFGVIEIPRAEVVRHQETPEGLLLGIKFHIPERKRQELMRYLIRREIELRKAKTQE